MSGAGDVVPSTLVLAQESKVQTQALPFYFSLIISFKFDIHQFSKSHSDEIIKD